MTFKGNDENKLHFQKKGSVNNYSPLSTLFKYSLLSPLRSPPLELLPLSIIRPPVYVLEDFMLNKSSFHWVGLGSHGGQFLHQFV